MKNEILFTENQRFKQWWLWVGFLGKGRALNISGSQGLQLEFTDHKKLLIGTNKPEELEKVLHEIGRLN